MSLFDNEEGMYWPSFTDLMITLFFIMLVLFVWAYSTYNPEAINRLKEQLEVTQRQVESIKKIERALKELPDKYFEYDPRYKRFSLKKNIEFETKKYDIRPQYYGYLLQVGREIEKLISRLQDLYRDKDIRYVVIIEGMASKDGYEYNYELSYQRALAIYRFWQRHGIQFDEKICEVQIAGSGTGGIGRFPPAQEKRNQRILIHILPKVEYFADEN
ncbi:MAG: hypothetical protein KatS3mg033_0667 [Thermonema sp.]|uniref:OmpA family protein n=1 Tax=Thermonema sp. TaxID=2231181 RepID=UPI0021DD0D72|nr:OmpA family protein [Thermonema sp.]GIV38867.1 MAG: hypothetical protein KatS3mg033_0667 [Thermonema sp.]